MHLYPEHEELLLSKSTILNSENKIFLKVFFDLP